LRAGDVAESVGDEGQDVNGGLFGEARDVGGDERELKRLLLSALQAGSGSQMRRVVVPVNRQP
jgi:hypothetical protein